MARNEKVAEELNKLEEHLSDLQSNHQSVINIVALREMLRRIKQANR